MTTNFIKEVSKQAYENDRRLGFCGHDLSADAMENIIMLSVMAAAELLLASYGQYHEMSVREFYDALQELVDIR